jgi:uncharacterized protein (TIGR02246 family)
MASKSQRVVLIIFFFALFSIASLSAARTTDSSADSAAIKKAVDNFIDCFNQHDAHAIAMTFAEDADLTNTRGATTHSQQGMEKLFTTLFSGRLKTAHRTISIKNVRFFAPEIAMVDSRWEMTGTRADDGTEMPPRKGILALVMTKQSGHWLITVYHEPEL